MADTTLDAYIARFQNLPPINIYSISKDGQTASPWYEVPMPAVAVDLVVDELTMMNQMAIVTTEIQKWGRLAALCKRVWELEERKYREWRSGFQLAAIDPTTKPKGWKAPTIATLDSMYRVDPEYHRLYAAVERAEEAYNAVDSTLWAFRAKKDVLIAMKRRYHEDGAV